MVIMVNICCRTCTYFITNKVFTTILIIFCWDNWWKTWSSNQNLFIFWFVWSGIWNKYWIYWKGINILIHYFSFKRSLLKKSRSNIMFINAYILYFIVFFYFSELMIAVEKGCLFLLFLDIGFYILSCFIL